MAASISAFVMPFLGSSMLRVSILPAAFLKIKSMSVSEVIPKYNKELLKAFFGHCNDQKNFAIPVLEQVLEPDPFNYYESLGFMSVS